MYFMNLILLLFAGADACDSVLREKVCQGKEYACNYVCHFHLEGSTQA